MSLLFRESCLDTFSLRYLFPVSFVFVIMYLVPEFLAVPCKHSKKRNCVCFVYWCIDVLPAWHIEIFTNIFQISENFYLARLYEEKWFVASVGKIICLRRCWIFLPTSFSLSLVKELYIRTYKLSNKYPKMVFIPNIRIWYMVNWF